MKRILLVLAALMALPAMCLGQTIEGPTEIQVEEGATLTLTPEITGVHMVIVIPPNVLDTGLVGTYAFRAVEQPSPPPPTNEAAAAIIVEGDGDRPLELGRALGRPEMAPYLGQDGVLSVLNQNVANESNQTPDALRDILEGAEGLPALVLLDEDNAVLSSEPCPETMSEIIAKLPAAEPAAMPPGKKLEELPTIDKLPIPTAAQFQLMVGMQGVQELSPDEQLKMGVPFGLLPQPPLQAMDATFNVLPRDQWESTERRHFVRWVLAQINGMCTANATVQCLHMQRLMQGQPAVRLSPEHLYMKVSSWGRGSTLWECLEEAHRAGVADAETVPQNKWRPRQWPSGTVENALRHKILAYEYFSGSSTDIFNKVATAIQQNQWCNVGIIWPGGGGHSIMALDLAYRDNTWGFVILNSWGEDWGDGGMAWMPERQFSTLNRFGAFCVKSATLPADETEYVLAP